MKLTIDRNDLAVAVVFAAQGCGRSSTYGGILLTSGPEGIWLQGSDGLVSFRSTVPGCYAEGRILLPGVFAQVVPGLTGEGVSLSLDGNQMTVTCGRSKYMLPVLPADQYPVHLPELLPIRGGVDGEELALALKRLLPAVDRTGRTGTPVLSGIQLSQGDQLILLATDKYVLSRATCRFSATDVKAPVVILPASVAARLTRLTGDVTLAWGENLIQVAGDSGSVTTRSLAGKFPAWTYPHLENWTRIGPDFLPAVKRAAVTGAVSLTFGDDLLVESAGETGSFAETVGFGYAGNARFVLGSQMLLDGLAGCTGNAEIGFTEPGKAVYLRDDNFLWACQPRRET